MILKKKHNYITPQCEKTTTENLILFQWCCWK